MHIYKGGKLMDKKFILDTLKLLTAPAKKQDIPVQRAVSALGVSALTVNAEKHQFLSVEYLIYPNNLYFIFDSRAPIDENGNYISPLFQDSRYNSLKPVWQEFRERVEAKLGTSITYIFFGDYKIEGNEEFFTVKTEPKNCRWRYTKKANKDSVFITTMSKEEALEYQDILDEIRINHAIRATEDQRAREKSRQCRQETITSLDSDYADEFELFTFNPETFRFRQFTTEFLYTPEGRAAFDRFYQEICVPYRNDEIADALWREKSHDLENRLTSDEDLGPELRLCSVHGFKILRRKDGGCDVESDLEDDRTGHAFRLTVKSQKFDDILNAVTTELTVVFQRKRQARRATATLQSLASKK